MIQLSSTRLLSNGSTVSVSFLPIVLLVLPEGSMVQLFDCPAKFTTPITTCSLAAIKKLTFIQNEEKTKTGIGSGTGTGVGAEKRLFCRNDLFQYDN